MPWFSIQGRGRLWISERLCDPHYRKNCIHGTHTPHLAPPGITRMGDGSHEAFNAIVLKEIAEHLQISVHTLTGMHYESETQDLKNNVITIRPAA